MSNRGKELVQAVQREAERLGLHCSLGRNAKTQFVDLSDGHQTRRVPLALTPSDKKAVIYNVSLVRRLARDMTATRAATRGGASGP